MTYAFRSCASGAKAMASEFMSPVNVPTSASCKLSNPPAAQASNPTSRSKRCCGSQFATSTGFMRKSSASKTSGPRLRNAPYCVVFEALAGRALWSSTAWRSQRASGTWPTAMDPACDASQSAAGDRSEDGSRVDVARTAWADSDAPFAAPKPRATSSSSLPDK